MTYKKNEAIEAIQMFGVVPEDRVNHPSHYTFGKIQVADAIVDWKLDFLRGNVVKYVARAGKKEEEGMTNNQKEIQDLEKALWYLNRAIKELKKAN